MVSTSFVYFPLSLMFLYIGPTIISVPMMSSGMLSAVRYLRQITSRLIVMSVCVVSPSSSVVVVVPNIRSVRALPLFSLMMLLSVTVLLYGRL